MCLYPKLIQNRKYKSNKKNGGIIPPVPDERVKLVPVGCQNCMECRKQKAREWNVRMQEEIKERKNGKFVTLTFSNESLRVLLRKHQDKFNGLTGYELDNKIAKVAVRLFLERWRRKFKKSLRHWLVSELGHAGTENIHLHGIVWTDESLDHLEKIWEYGFVWKGKNEKGRIINYVNGRTVSYITKYVTKLDLKHKTYKAIILTSPGIGSGYIKRADSKLNKFNGKNTIETYRSSTGHKIAMPVYWRNKIYSEKERELLWLQKLDKEERWVCGEKVASTDTYNYLGLLKHYRRLNKQLGYGDDEKNWELEQYERERRIIRMKERLKINAA